MGRFGINATGSFAWVAKMWPIKNQRDEWGSGLRWLPIILKMQQQTKRQGWRWGGGGFKKRRKLGQWQQGWRVTDGDKGNGNSNSNDNDFGNGDGDEADR
jgi:hypothetical protein